MLTNLTEKQKEFWKCANKRWNVKSGATRSGKTYLDYYLIPKRIRALSGKDGLYVLLGNTKSTLQRNIIEPLQNIWSDKLVSDIKADNTAYMFGEKVHCLGADKITQVNKIRGSSIKYCYGDEVVTWSEPVFDMLKSRLDKAYSCFDGTCNPENPKHWFKRFIDSDVDLFLQEYTLYDNPFLASEFVKNLEREYAGTVYFDRYILGKWVQAEGIIFPKLAADAKPWLVSKDELPKMVRWCEVGFDIGGNGSAYALTATVEDYNGTCYVVKSKKYQAGEMAMEDIEKIVTEFCNTVENYGYIVERINTDHVAVIVNSINDKTPFRADLTYKPPLEERVVAITKMLANKKVLFLDGECDSLIDEMQELVFDSKSERSIPLDDGTMQIDTWDSFIYSLSGNWNYLDI